MHDQVVDIVRVGMTEREFARRMRKRFEELQFSDGYSYGMWEGGLWGYHDIRNPKHPEMNLIAKFQLTDRPFMDGDVFNRMTSGMSYLGEDADVDRTFYVRRNPPANVEKWYRVTSMCTQAMGEAMRPGVTCAEIFELENRIAKENGLPERVLGREGHWSNPSGLSIHPDCRIVLEPGMVISVEPTFCAEFGYFDNEDIYVITDNGSRILHTPAATEIPCCSN